MALKRPLSRTELKNAVTNLLAANTTLQNALAASNDALAAANAKLTTVETKANNSEAAITVINTDHDEVALFRAANKTQLKNTFNFTTLDADGKDRWEKLLKVLKGIVKEDLTDA